MGPTAKVALTVALVFPMLVCAYGLALAHERAGNIYFALPLGILGVLSVMVLPSVWDRGTRT